MDAINFYWWMTTQTEGYDLAKQIAEQPEFSQMKVLLVTGLSRLPDGCSPQETWLPVERVLSKPIEPAQLLSEIEKVLGT